MRIASTLLLALLTALPLAAHGHHGCRGPRRTVVVVRPVYGDPGPWREARRWACDHDRRPWGYREADEDLLVVQAPLPRPLLPPVRGCVVLRLR